MRLLATGLMGMVCLLSPLVEAAEYYVAPNGSDTNRGSLEAPFRTLQHAASQLLPGDTCYLRGGTYRETLTPACSGTPSAPVTFAAYSNELVTVSAADLVTGWQYLSGNIYSAPVGWNLGNGYNQVFVDGMMIHQARTPNFGTGDCFHPTSANVTIGGSQNNIISSVTWGGHPDNYWVGAWFCGAIDVRWSWQCARVISSTGCTITVDNATKSNPWFAGSGCGFLWGLNAMLDGDNEWQVSAQSPSNLLYVRLAGGANPAAHRVEMKRRNWCINFNGRSFVTVRGLQLRGGAVWLDGNGNTVEHCQARFLSHYMRYTWGYAYDGDLPQGSGILMDGNSNTVYACTICDTAGSGIISTGNDNLITRNLIYNTDYSGTYGCGIRLAGLRNHVTYNTVHTSGRDILQPGGSGHSISFNDFYGPGQMCQDTGVLYIWGVDARGGAATPTRVSYNWFHDNIGPGPRPLIYLDNWCRNFVVDHNVLWNSAGDSGLRINAPAAGHLICNNTLFNCDDIGTHTYDMWPANNPNPAFWTSDRYQYSSANNLFLGASPQYQLNDWAHRDFRLRPNAPAINTGVAIPGYTDFFPLVGPADKGACEFGSLVWKPGVDGWCQPTLAIAPAGNGAVKLTAPPGAAFFQLLVATNSAPPLTWRAVTNTPSVSLTEWSLTLDVPPGEVRLFRLQSN